MALNISTTSSGFYQQYGYGVPIHISLKGSQYTDLNTAIIYINKDGISTWESLGGGTSTTTLQQAYDNSVIPEIQLNGTLGSLLVKNNTGNPDSTTNLLSGFNSLGDVTGFIRSDGKISGTSINTNTLTATTISATTYQNLPNSLTGYVTTNTSQIITGLKTFSNIFYLNKPDDSYFPTDSGGGFQIGDGGSTYDNFNFYSLDGSDSDGFGYVHIYSNPEEGNNIIHCSIDNQQDARFNVNYNDFNLKHIYGGMQTALYVDGSVDKIIIEGTQNKFAGLGTSLITGTKNFEFPNTSGTIALTSDIPNIDIRVTGATYSNNTFTFINNTGGTFNTLFNVVTGLTVNGNLTVNIISASTTVNLGTKTTTTIDGSNNQSAIVVSGRSTIGGTGYVDFIKVTNTSAGATNINKTIRVNSIGSVEFINSAYNATIFSVADNGVVSISRPATVVDNSATNNTLNIGTYGQLFDDGNFHIHTSKGSVWINSLDGGPIRLGTQTNDGNSSVIVDTTTVGHSFFTKVQSEFNVAFGTEITMDNLKVRINSTGGSGGLIQAGAVSGSFEAYTTLLGNIAGAAVRGDTNSGGITFTTTYQNISSAQGTLSAGGDTTTLHLIDTKNNRIYRITAIHCQDDKGGYTSIERMA